MAVAAPAAAQAPDASWRTVETAHFRVHYPLAYEAWSRRLASRLESIRDAVSAAVGYAPPQTVEVVVADPEAESNGSAWPLLDAPAIVVWATPPGATSSLGHLADWGELVAVHEDAHLAHLLRPSRNPIRASIERWLVPVGPIATKTPRWAIEGYATLVEGRVTGSGRPGSAFRAAVLRDWARAGRLPSYGALADGDDSFLGGSMAYLVGSAFLEWAEARSGDPTVLPKLWAAETSQGGRDFDAAWTRVFGHRPSHDYDRFVAETTAEAIAEERARRRSLHEGELWLDRDWATGALAVSPDGSRLAALVFEHDRPTTLVVWDLAAAPPGPHHGSGRRERPRDPEDPAAAPRAPASRRRAAEIEEPPGCRFVDARFLPDGRSLLVSLVRPDLDGVDHAELARWTPGHTLARLAGADVRDADPLPDGRHAIAVRWRGGASQLVVLDFATGAVRPLTRARVDVIDDQPRIAPDGATLAWLEHRAGRWELRLAPLVGAPPALGVARTVELPGGGEPLAIAWRHAATHIYASVARGGRIAIEAIPVAPQAGFHQVTRTLGADLDPAPTPDGRTLFYLTLGPDGLDVRRLALDAATEQQIPPAPPKPTPALPAFAPLPLGPSRPYGLGRATYRPLVGGWLARESGPLELGVRAGDLLDRWHLVALGAVGGAEAARRGAALRAGLRLLPVDIDIDAARIESLGATADVVQTTLGRTLDLGRGRLELAAGASHAWRDRGAGDDRSIALAHLLGATAFRRGGLELRPWAGADWDRELGGDRVDWTRFRAGVTLMQGDARLSLSAARDRAAGATRDADRIRLGGVPSSLAPPSFDPGRIDAPALPAATLVGLRLDRIRLRASLPALPVELLVERDRLPRGAGGATLRMIGVTRDWRLEPMPLVGLPGLALSAGLVRVDGDRLDGEFRAWLGLTIPFQHGGAGAALDSTP